MVTDPRLKDLSKFMSYLLRHNPKEFAIDLDAEGFASIEELLPVLRKRIPDASKQDIQSVVERVEPEKRRFEIVGNEIRANYGHSLPSRIRHQAGKPPAVLYHGTADHAWPGISRTGLRPMSRQYVHLTTKKDVAMRIGARHGRPCVLSVDAATAHRDGITFYKANDAFWLVDALPPGYVTRATA